MEKQMNQRALTILLVLVGAITDTVLAQGERRKPAPWRDGPLPGRQAELRAGEKVVRGSPYSAVAVTTRVQTLANGTRLTSRSEATIYRDSAGRIRREQSATKISPLGREVEVPATIFISDPVARVTYTLYPDQKIGVRRNLKPRRKDLPGEAGPRAERRQGQAEMDLLDQLGRAGKGRERQEQDLGRETIEGVEVVGRKTVAVIPVDEIGNDQPIEIVHEKWVSEDLRTVIRSRHHDPRLGENSFDLTRIDRTEPPASLFVVPEGYVITNQGPPEDRRGPRRR